MQITDKQIIEMQRQIAGCQKNLDALAQGYRSPEKINTLLDSTMQFLEQTCISMRHLTEQMRSQLPNFRFGHACYHTEEIYGEVTLLDTGWLDIRLNALLPHCKMIGGTEYITDTIHRLLHIFQVSGGEIPMFGKAFVAIVEHSSPGGDGAYDHDNKGFKAVINALKGRLFPD